MTDVKTDYPNRYYASYDTKASQPTPVNGWYDTWGMSSVANVPLASEMIPVDPTDWNDPLFRLPIGKGIQADKIIDYSAAPEPLSLPDQARAQSDHSGSYPAAVKHAAALL